MWSFIMQSQSAMSPRHVLTLTCQWKSGDDLHQNDADFSATDPAMQIRQVWVPSIGGVYVSCSSPSRELVGTVSR
jgi:hypothetical protein